MTEDQFCAKAFQYIWNTYPQTRRLLIHIPNEAKRSKIEWVQMKAKGLIPGAPDYIFLWKGKVYVIEAKDPKIGRISTEQKIVHQAIQAQNIKVFIVYSDEEFIRTIENIIHESGESNGTNGNTSSEFSSESNGSTPFDPNGSESNGSTSFESLIPNGSESNGTIPNGSNSSGSNGSKFPEYERFHFSPLFIPLFS